MNITEDIKYIGVSDGATDLFEGQYSIPNGITYNSYIILDEMCAVMDSVDAAFGSEWISNLKAVLGARVPDYLIVQHMEPDHSASIIDFIREYPTAKIVASRAAFAMMRGFFCNDFADRQVVVTEGDTLSLGRHTLQFLTAPMVHWPEVIMTYDVTDRVLFSADGFGRFGSACEDEPWADEARRYYIGIVGKYGKQVEAVLKKAGALDIEIIAPLHGPVLTHDLGLYLGLYSKWASYTPEERGVTVAYASVYGNTAKAAVALYEELKARGERVTLFDLARCDVHEAIASAFRFDRLVLAAPTYNADVFPAMKHYILGLVERGFTKRTVGLIENGSWAPRAAAVMKGMLAESKDITFTEGTVKITSALNSETKAALSALADELCK
ncbi:MAG: FprA family A-type flavoprotein [Clostridia bacterium]|nr:FprA family A-type flavoprotein [Clostridia bacterium]